MYYIEVKYLRLISHHLRNFRQKNNDVFQFSCPFCGDSKKDKTKARGYVFKKKDSMVFKCYNCGKTGNLHNILKLLNPILCNEYILEKYKDSKNTLSSGRVIRNKIENIKFNKVIKQRAFDNAEWCNLLPSNNACVEYLRSRSIPDRAFEMLLYTENFKKFIDELYPDHGKILFEEPRLVIPMYNKYNELYVVAGRSLEECEYKLRYVTVRVSNSDERVAFGVERVNETKPIRVVEGQIDSLFVNNCIAICSAELPIAAELYPKEKLILIPDNEPRAPIQIKNIRDFIKKGFNVVIFPEEIHQKDINLMVQAGIDIEDVINKNTFSGIRAELEFNRWKKC